MNIISTAGSVAVVISTFANTVKRVESLASWRRINLQGNHGFNGNYMALCLYYFMLLLVILFQAKG